MARYGLSAESSEKVDDLAAGEVGPERDVAGNVGQAAVQGLDVVPRVAAQEGDGAGVGADEAEEDADGGGLPCAVRAEEAVHLAGLHLEVEAVESDGRSEGLAQTGYGDGSTHESDGTPFSEKRECTKVFV